MIKMFVISAKQYVVNANKSNMTNRKKVGKVLNLKIKF